MDRAISSALEMNKTLRKLNLSGNNIESEGARFLFEALERNKTLISLNVDDNHFGNIKECIYNTFQINETLCHLSLRCTGIDDEVAYAFTNVLEYSKTFNRTLTLLCIEDNDIHQDHIFKIENLLLRNRKLPVGSYFIHYLNRSLSLKK
jgi:hypothetical protein